MRRTGPALIALLLLGGCVSAYHRPSLRLADRYAHAPEPPDSPAPEASWWRTFGDLNLNRVVDQVLAYNRDLATAALRLQKAQLTVGIAQLNQGPIASGGVTGARVGRVRTYNASVSVSYEVDLWARLASTTSAARWEARATQEDQDAIALVLVGTTARLYWDIGYTHQQIASGQVTLDYQRRTLDLVAIQHRLGAVSGVESAEAEQAVSTQIAVLSVLAQHLVEDQAAMTLLMGDGPQAAAWEPQTLPVSAALDIPAGTPASLLSRRPDVKAAELRLRGSLAARDAARAELYPTLNLTGGGSSASPALKSLLNNPVGQIMAAMSLPILDYPRHRLNTKIARVNDAIAVLAFKTALFNGLRDVDNALSNRRQIASQGEALGRALIAAQSAERLYGVRYRSGSVALRIWLDAQQSERAAQLAFDNNRLASLINQSTLYQALGGDL